MYYYKTYKYIDAQYSGYMSYFNMHLKLYITF